ncbi:MAG: hypothetical protein O7G85_08195 [Planctomycetota bacterium]|nr:hypothetical protein [Planctomycetota bacterium]
MTQSRFQFNDFSAMTALLAMCIMASPASGQCDSEESSTDCNENGIPDACELDGTITLQSGAMGPFDGANEQRYEFESSPVALADLEVTCIARANLANWTERVDVWINDIPVRSIYLFATDCDPDAIESFVLTRETYMEALASGAAVLRFVPSQAVDPGFCSESFLDVRVELTTEPGADENQNGVLDECEKDDGQSLCEGLQPTVYVDDRNVIVGGPLHGRRYRGVLVGTPGADVFRGTSGNDLIVTVGNRDLDTICGNGGNDHITGESQGQSDEHRNSQASTRKNQSGGKTR